MPGNQIDLGNRSIVLGHEMEVRGYCEETGFPSAANHSSNLKHMLLAVMALWTGLAG